MEELRKSLIVYEWRNKILNLVQKNNVVIIASETGSGKTTQIPQYLYENALEKLNSKKKQQTVNGKRRKNTIAITQPRRVAAMSVAKRVAEETGTKLGELVGYRVRFDDKSCGKTKMKFMTDGMLVRAAMLSPMLEQFGIIILDEAHERTLQTDILLGILKRAIAKRRNLKVVIMSATLDVDLFKNFFSNEHTKVEALQIPGRSYEVEMFYTEQAQPDYLDSAMISILQIHKKHKLDNGSVLVFLTGQEDIETLEQLLKEYAKQLKKDEMQMLICPLFSAMPQAQQMKVFDPTPSKNVRKIILATNIAETSITINGVKFVVDTGLVKQRSYEAGTGMDRLSIEPVSQAQAWQRSGRAGREAPGQCYRLFEEDQFEKLQVAAIPEIQRVNLEMVALQLKSMNIHDILHFDFIQKPSTMAFVRALERLYALEALDQQGMLTELGTRMVQFPISPMYSKMLLKSTELGCAEEALSIIAMLSVETIFYAPKQRRDEAGDARKKFLSYDGDHITLLNVYEQFMSSGSSKTSVVVQSEQRRWCRDHFINARSMQRVLQVRQQLKEYVQALKLPIVSSLPDTVPVRKSIVSGCFLNAAVLSKDMQNKSAYKAMCMTKTKRSSIETMKIHPSSALFIRQPLPTYVLYNEVVCTTKNYIRGVLRIEREWLTEMVPKFFKSIRSSDDA